MCVEERWCYNKGLFTSHMGFLMLQVMQFCPNQAALNYTKFQSKLETLAIIIIISSSTNHTKIALKSYQLTGGNF